MLKRGVDRLRADVEAGNAGPADPAVVHGDGRVDQVAPQGPKAGEDSILIRTRKPRVADDVGH